MITLESSSLQPANPQNDRSGSDLPLIQPRLGTLSIMGLSAVAVLQIVFGIWVYTYLSSIVGKIFWIASMWFGCVATTSICLSFPIRLSRVAIGVGVLLWHALLMSVCWREDLMRYVALFSVLAVCQALVSTMLQLPCWAIGRTRSAGGGSMQFSIRSVLVLTAGSALLMRAFQVYDANLMRVPLAAIPIFVLLLLGCVSLVLSRDRLLQRLSIVVATLIGGVLLVGWVSLNPPGTTSGGSFRQLVWDLLTANMQNANLQTLLLTFTFYTGLLVCWLTLGRLDERDYQQQHSSKPLSTNCPA